MSGKTLTELIAMRKDMEREARQTLRALKTGLGKPRRLTLGEKLKLWLASWNKNTP